MEAFGQISEQSEEDRVHILIFKYIFIFYE
jgi:hypothetical protein